MESIIKVQFIHPVEGRTEYYFGSLKAIYERFSTEEIGCNVQRLWGCSISEDNPKITSKCIISKHPVIRCSSKQR